MVSVRFVVCTCKKKQKKNLQTDITVNVDLRKVCKISLTRHSVQIEIADRTIPSIVCNYVTEQGNAKECDQTDLLFTQLHHCLILTVHNYCCYPLIGC